MHLPAPAAVNTHPLPGYPVAVLSTSSHPVHTNKLRSYKLKLMTRCRSSPSPVFKFANDRRAALGLPVPPRNPAQRPMVVDGAAPIGGGGPGDGINNTRMEIAGGLTTAVAAVVEAPISPPAAAAPSLDALPPAPVPSSCSYMVCLPQKKVKGCRGVSSWWGSA